MVRQGRPADQSAATGRDRGGTWSRLCTRAHMCKWRWCRGAIRCAAMWARPGARGRAAGAPGRR